MAISTTTEALDLPPAMLDVATSSADWIVILPVVLCLIGGAFMMLLRTSKSTPAAMAVLILGAVILCDVQLLLRILETGQPVSMTMGNWLPPFGISFTADTMSAGFTLAAAIVTLVVVLYSQWDVEQREIRYGYYSLILLLLAGVSGAFLTGDLFNLYVWFEVMLIASFGLLIMGGRKVQLDGAVKYGFLNFLATTFFLTALGYLYGLLGTLNMADIIRVAPEAPAGPMTAIAALLLLAFGMKAAAFPVNAWLPASYHTPSPAVSALFAGVLTKVGVYALLRSLVALMPATRDTLDPVLTGVAALTLVLAPMGALSQTNLRRALGFIVIGGIGAVMAGLAMPTLRGLAGASMYAFHSILTMTALYLVAGLIERMTRETDTRNMGGVYAANSPLSILFIILVFAAAGLPPFLGFWPKILLVEASLEDPSYLLTAAILINSLLTAIAGTRLWSHIFWRRGREGELSEQPNDRLVPLSGKETLWGMVPVGALVALIVVIGLTPNPLFEAGRNAAIQLLQTESYITATGFEVTP